MHIGSERVECAADTQVNPWIFPMETPEERIQQRKAVCRLPRGASAHIPDEQLLAAARDSDHHSFMELCNRYVDRIYGKILHILRNREDTEDVVQDSLFKAYLHLKDFRGSCSFSTWLMRIAINSAFMLLRKKRSRSEVSFDQPGEEEGTWDIWEFSDPALNPEQTCVRHQTLDLLSRAVKQLPHSYRDIVEQYHHQELSLREAADRVGITMASAKSRLHRARLNIRAGLAKKRVSIADAHF